MKSLSENALKRVDDFKYLGSHIMCSAKDFRIRAWKSQASNASQNLIKCGEDTYLIIISSNVTCLRPLLNHIWHPPLERFHREETHLSICHLKRHRHKGWGPPCYHRKQDRLGYSCAWYLGHGRKMMIMMMNSIFPLSYFPVLLLLPSRWHWVTSWSHA